MPSIFAPVVSPEHGAYVVLLTAFAIGVVAAGTWNVGTMLALIAVLAAHQAQFPLLQMARRRSLVARYAVWTGIYGALAVAATALIVLRAPSVVRVLWVAAVVFGAAIGFGAIRRYQSLGQELVAFAGLALAAPLASVATTGFMARETLGLWLVLVLAFQMAVFAVRIRSRGRVARRAALVFAAIAVLSAAGIVLADLVPAPYIALLVPAWARTGYAASSATWLALPIRTVGFVETAVALATLGVAALVVP